MRLSTPTLVLALSSLVAGCGAVHSYPLVPPQKGPRAAFPGIVACASGQHYQIAQHADSVNVEVDPGVWVQFMDQPSGFNMVIVVMKDSPDANARADAAKAKGDSVYACALKGPGAR